MPATLDLPAMQQLAASFPNEGWQTFYPRDCIADRKEQILSDWSPTEPLVNIGGVYTVLLPSSWFAAGRTLHLHAPHRHRGVGIPFEFKLLDFTGDGYGVVYVGKTANLGHRFRGHLRRGQRKDGGQVKFGVFDCDIEQDIEAALKRVRKYAKIIYTILSGPDHCANRDVLEMALCARFGPPFNIKSER